MLRNWEEVDSHEAKPQENRCDKVGEDLSHEGVAAASADVGPNDVLGLRCSLYKRSVFDVIPLEGVIIWFSEDALDPFEDVELVEVKDEVSGDVGLESDENAC